MTTKENLNLEVFSSPEFGQMRILAENRKYLFCASDAATALGYSNPRSALQRHCKGVVKRDTLTSGGTQTLSYISEGDLYRLIVHSKLPGAEKFETSVYKGYKQDKIEMRGDRAEMSDFPLYQNTVAGGLDRRDQTIGGFSFVVKIYAVPVVEIIG